MSYQFYLGRALLPVAPSKMDVKIKNQNKSINLIDQGEVNLLKAQGLKTISFDALFPNVSYPFANHGGGFRPASAYLAELESLKVAQQPFQFIVSRSMPSGRGLHSTNLTVALEDYTIKDDAKQGFDVVVSIKLKEWVAYGTKTCTVTILPDGTAKAEASTMRPTASDFVGRGSTVTVNGDICTDPDGTDTTHTASGDTYTVDYVGDGDYPYHVTNADGTQSGWTSNID